MFVKISIPCLIVLLLCGGCGSGRGELFSDAKLVIVWPGPPEKARIQFLGSFSTQADLKKEVSSLEAFRRILFGQNDIGVLVGPYSLAVNDQEQLYVVDRSGGVIHIMDLRNSNYRQFSQLDHGETLISPIGLAFVGKKIYVSDSVLGKIFVGKLASRLAMG